MIEKMTKRKLSFHKFIDEEKPITKNDYKYILLHKKILLFSILISVLFWILIIIALATPNYDVLTNNSIYSNMKIKYNVYIAIFFFLALGMWAINSTAYIYAIVQMNKLDCQISKELSWLSIINIFFSVVIIFILISLFSTIVFLKKHPNPSV